MQCRASARSIGSSAMLDVRYRGRFSVPVAGVRARETGTNSGYAMPRSGNTIQRSIGDPSRRGARAARPHTRPPRHKIHAISPGGVSLTVSLSLSRSPRDTEPRPSPGNPPASSLADHPTILIIDSPRDLPKRSVTTLSFADVYYPPQRARASPFRACVTALGFAS